MQDTSDEFKLRDARFCCEYWLLGLLFGSLVLVIIIILWLVPRQRIPTYHSTDTIVSNGILSSSTVTTTISITTSTETATTITTNVMVAIYQNYSIVGLWKTMAGQNGTQSTAGFSNGNYVAAESPFKCFDNDSSTKYTSFGPCAVISTLAVACGLNTGFHLTILSGPVAIRSFRLCTANDNPPRDPLTMTIEGSNQQVSSLFDGSSWILIYNGSTGLDVDPGRRSYGIIKTFSNSILYASYRFLMTSKRSIDDAIQYSEIQLFA